MGPGAALVSGRDRPTDLFLGKGKGVVHRATPHRCPSATLTRVCRGRALVVVCCGGGGGVEWWGEASVDRRRGVRAAGGRVAPHTGPKFDLNKLCRANYIISYGKVTDLTPSPTPREPSFLIPIKTHSCHPNPDSLQTQYGCCTVTRCNCGPIRFSCKFSHYGK